MKCPSCGAADQTGKFCAACGAGLDIQCSSCGAEIPAGARFCTTCGDPVAGAATEPASRAPWVIAVVSILVVAILVVVFLPRGTSTVGPATTNPSAPFMGAGDPQGSTGGSALSSDMRTNADRLFNRIMMAAEQGDDAEVAQFMPMAIQAYGMVEDLDNDGIYHLAMLHLTAGAFDQALEASRRILGDEPEHLLGLAVAAEAAAGAGDSVQADGFWRRYLEAYPEEAAKPLPEYVDHQPMLGEYQRIAQEAIGPQ